MFFCILALLLLPLFWFWSAHASRNPSSAPREKAKSSVRTVQVQNNPGVGGIGSEENAKNDRELKKDIEAKLRTDPFVNSDEVKVMVKGGVVTLTGRVNTLTERAAATADAYQAGAVRVINKLSIKERPVHSQP
jgi:osmotically-inducible protein OsmY